jgi:hypothetical protein
MGRWGGRGGGCDRGSAEMTMTLEQALAVKLPNGKTVGEATTDEVESTAYVLHATATLLKNRGPLPAEELQHWQVLCQRYRIICDASRVLDEHLAAKKR